LINNVESLNNNIIIGEPILNKSKIVFKGENNILFFDDGITLEDTAINFLGNNSLVVIRQSKHPIKLDLRIYNDSTFYLGKECSMNKAVFCVASEAKNIIIGDDCLFANLITIRTGDAHRIYDISTRKRINEGRSVFLGDHIWLGTGVTILKGSKIHSGSILGANAVLTGKEVKSCCVFAGNPAKEIKSNVVYNRQGSHGLTPDEIQKISVISETEIEKFIYKYNEKEYIDFNNIDNDISSISTGEKRLEYLKERLFKSTKNRFSL